MNYYRIKPKFTSPTWAYAEREGAYLNYGKEYCPLCGKALRDSVGAHRYKLSSGSVGDFIFTPLDILVSERVKSLYEKSGLGGIESFTECEVLRRGLPTEVKFFIPKIKFSQKKLGFATLQNKKRANDKSLPKCSLCTASEKNDSEVGNVYFGGAEEYDIFAIYERPKEIFCSGRFLDFCAENGFTNISEYAKEIKNGKTALTKDEVFSIMGNYYGNAYWRGCDLDEEDLRLITEILDKINALGYNFSNLHRLTDHEDIRFIPIVLEYIHNKKWVGSLLSAFHCRSYYKYTPELIALFKNPEYVRYRWDIGNALLACRHKKFVPQYLEIVNSEEYGEEPDLIMEILCLLKAQEALPRLLELYEKYPDVWRWDLLKYGWYFKDRRILPYIEPYLESKDAEYRRMAKKALEKLALAE